MNELFIEAVERKFCLLRERKTTTPIYSNFVFIYLKFNKL